MTRPGFFGPALALSQRELVRFFRQPSRVIGACATPLIFWIVVGSGLGSSFRPQGGQPGYLRYLYPGIVLLIVLFTSIFSAMSLIEDRAIELEPLVSDVVPLDAWESVFADLRAGKGIKVVFDPRLGAVGSGSSKAREAA